MKKIYIVTKGTYSDYSIVSVFSTKEKAEKFMEAFPDDREYGGYNWIETYKLDPGEPQLLNNGYSVWMIHMYHNGETPLIKKIDNPNSWDYKNINNLSIYRPCFNTQKYKAKYLEIRVLAKDEKHAIKIVNEKRVQLIANNKWK